MNRTAIEWCDLTWNPIRARLKDFTPLRDGLGKLVTRSGTGTFCTRISPGCQHCYASVINKRFGTGLEYTVPNLEKHEFFIDERILEEPLRRKKPATIFVGDMFDLFHEAIPKELIFEVYTVMSAVSWHTFQVLTKRAARMQEIVRGINPAVPWLNIWHGVSVEDKQRADERIPLLLKTPAAVRFLSVEPQLEAIDLREKCACGHRHSGKCCAQLTDKHGSYFCLCPATCLIPRGISWVIVGGESGPGARPFNLAWAESLLEQCRAADVPFFMKQIGSRPYFQGKVGTMYPPISDRKGGEPSVWPEHLRVREFPALKSAEVPA